MEKRTHRITPFCKSNLAMMVIYFPVKFELVSFSELESGNDNVDGQTYVGYINLIGGLVTCKSPKKATYIKPWNDKNGKMEC